MSKINWAGIVVLFLAVVFVFVAGVSNVRIAKDVQAKQVEDLATKVSMGEYQEEVENAYGWAHRGDIFCGLEENGVLKVDQHGEWSGVKFRSACNFAKSDVLDISKEPRSLTRDELQSSLAWYLNFLIDDYFDSEVLDSPSAMANWCLGKTDRIDSSYCRPNDDSSSQTFQIEGKPRFKAGESVANFDVEKTFEPIIHDGRPRILAINLRGGKIHASFESLNIGQVRLEATYNVFYRVDKSQLIQRELSQDKNWTLETLREEKPQLFDKSLMVIELIAQTTHELSKTQSGWIVSGWETPDLQYRY